MVKTWTESKITSFEEPEFYKKLKKLLAEVVFITGGKMYDEKTETKFYQLQLKTINKFLLSSFPYFSFGEISNAFYLNSAGKFGEIHSHYGREINVEFIGKVLSAYKDYKQKLFNIYGHELQAVLNPPKELPPTEVLTDEDYSNDRRKDIEGAYQNLIVHLNMNDELFPEYFYNQLVFDGLVPNDAYQQKMKEARISISKNKQIDIMNKQKAEKSGRLSDIVSTNKELEKLRYLVRTNQLEKHKPVVTVSKQMIVKEFFLKRMSDGYKNIYVKDEN